MQLGGTRRTEVNAVHEDQARALLIRLGVADAFDRGELRCSGCGNNLGEVGMGAARADGERVVFSCGRLDCLREFS